MHTNQPTGGQLDADLGETLAELDEGTRIEQATATVLRLFILAIALYVLLKILETLYGLPVPF
jgi:hypothetical protein